MDFITDFIQRLQNAPSAELPQLRAEYETYLATLTVDEQAQVINRVNPVLRGLASQSINRLEEAASAYLSRDKGRVSA